MALNISSKLHLTKQIMGRNIIITIIVYMKQLINAFSNKELFRRSFFGKRTIQLYIIYININVTLLWNSNKLNVKCIPFFDFILICVLPNLVGDN